MLDLRVGEDIAGYRVLELIGAGGMGRVYRAVQPRLERIVALKVIRPEIAADEAYRRRFRREAQLAAAVDHANVVPVYEAGEADGALFVAMRWVAGTDLRHVLRTERSLDPARAVRIVDQVAAALDVAHAIGLVHRDVKPGNVLIEGERLYLTDFGLARSLGGPGDSTVSSSFSGTLDYAAPESLGGGTPSPASDVYALGCVLFEILTGSVPYPDHGLLAKVQGHLAGAPPSPSERNPNLPRAIDHVVQRALAKDPRERFSSAGELGQAAARSLSDGRSRNTPRAQAKPRRWAAACASFASVVGVVLTLALNAAGSSDRRRLSPHSHTAPPPSSLHPCPNALIGPAQLCRGKHDGLENIGDETRPVRMRTLEITVNSVVLRTTIRSGTGATVAAPRGTEFIVIDATVTNRTGTPQVFEPAAGTVAGRQTALWLPADRKGDVEPFRGPGYADYSVEDPTAVTALSTPAAGLKLYPGVSISNAQLVFDYPRPSVRRAWRHIGLLDVHELGDSFADTRDIALIRVRL